MSNHLEITEMLMLINEPNRTNCFKIHLENWELFKQARGSTHLHQAWNGGYYDHVEETMNIAIVQHAGLSSLRPLPFSLSDALLVEYLHDIEKPWKYEFSEDGQIRQKEGLKDKTSQRQYRDNKFKEYNIVLTPAQQNALEHVEGELHDYSNTQRAMNELGAFCHVCDVISARIWHDFPKRDPWLQQ